MTIPAGDPYVVSVETITTPAWKVFDALDNLPGLNDPESQTLYPEGTIVACTATDCTKDPAVVGEEAEASATYYVVEAIVDDTVDPPETNLGWVPRNGLIIEVNVITEEDSFPSYAAANGNGLGGAGTAEGFSMATASAWGMQLGDGNDNVENRGSISVTADAEAAFGVSADGDNVGNATGTAESFATASAFGFDLGNGNNSLLNAGDLTVVAQASTQSLSEVTGGDICIWFFGWWCGGGGDGIGTSETTLDLVATGISSGDGIDTITNDDIITVTTAPIVRDDARKGEFVADVRRENSETINVYFSAVATGITTGGGDDEVINNGSLLVEARDLLSGCSDQACIDRINSKGIDSSTVEAFGILTGAGNDILRNNGLVSATRLVNGVTESQLAIDLGDGDDMLYLGADAEIVGSVSLGEGNDTLVLTGSPVVRNIADAPVDVNLGGDSETLMLMGAGEFMSNVTGVSQASKQGAGTYRITRLQPLATLAIDEGVIELADPDSGYSFSPGSQYSTYVNFDLRDQPELRSGQLLVAGDVSLDGAIDVERRGEDYIANDSRFLVVGAGGDLTGGFVDVTLPEPKPLLAFELETDTDAGAVNVVVDSPSFATVTRNPVYDQIGLGFDRLAPEATGDLEDVLGTLQQMESGFDEAFAANSPEAHTTPTTTAHSNGQQVTQFLMNHLGTSRASYRQPQTRGAAPSLSWSYDNNGIGFVGFSSNGQLNDGQGQILLAANDGTYVAPSKPRRRDARFQTWGMAATGRGDYDELDGYTGFDMDTNTYALGADFRVADRFLVGAMLGFADTEVDTREIVSSLDMESRYGGVYASWFTDRAFLEAGITYASQSFDNSREVKFMSIDRVAKSQHDGTGWLGFFGGGYEFRFNQLILEPYASIYYFGLKEDAFAETGADSLNQLVDERETTALFGELGSNLMIRQNLRSGALEWRARLGVNYDFEIDSASITYGYQGAPGTSFAVDDRSLSQESLRFGAGLSYVTERTTLALDYAGLANSDYAINSLALRLNLRF
jgi:outer membrane autotransporter protein